MNFNQEAIEQLLDGEWYRAPQEGWFVDNVVINPAQAKMEKKNEKRYSLSPLILTLGIKVLVIEGFMQDGQIHIPQWAIMKITLMVLLQHVLYQN